MSKRVNKNTEYIEFAREKIEQNMFSWQVREAFLNFYGEDCPSNSELSFIIETARAAVFAEIDLSAENIVLSHANKYEQDYQVILKRASNASQELQYSQSLPDEAAEDEDNKRRRTAKRSERTIQKRIAKYYSQCIDALKRKERVLGVVRPNMEIEFEGNLVDKFTMEPDHPFADLDAINISALDMKEKKEFLHLLRKAKGDYEKEEDRIFKVGDGFEDAEVIEDPEILEESRKYEKVYDKFKDDSDPPEIDPMAKAKPHALFLAEKLKEMHKKETDVVEDHLRNKKALSRLRKYKPRKK